MLLSLLSMKTFSDLEFKPCPIGNLIGAQMYFKNGYGVSVLRCKSGARYHSFTNTDHEWEVAVLEYHKGNWYVSMQSPLGDCIIGYLKEPEVSEIMQQVQELPKRKKR